LQSSGKNRWSNGQGKEKKEKGPGTVKETEGKKALDRRSLTVTSGN